MAKAKEPHLLSANPLPDVTDRLKEGRLVHVHMQLFLALGSALKECGSHSLGPIRSNYDSLYYIFCTTRSQANKLGMGVEHHKPKCCVVILDCCLQHPGHSERSEFQSIFVWTICSELLNLL